MTVIVCDYCGSGEGIIRTIGTDKPKHIHFPPCPAMIRAQRDRDREARESIRDMYRNSDVKARWR